MARIPLIDPADATGELATTFQEISDYTGGKIGNVWRALANEPKMLKAVWDRRQAVMEGENLSKTVKETVALAVSQNNDCEYCVVNHSAALGRLGESDERIDEIKDGKGRDSDEQALIDLCVRAVTDPNRLNDDDFDKVRSHGWNDAQIFEAVGVATHYTALNRFLDTFLVDLD